MARHRVLEISLAPPNFPRAKHFHFHPPFPLGIDYYYLRSNSLRGENFNRASLSTFLEIKIHRLKYHLSGGHRGIEFH